MKTTELKEKLTNRIIEKMEQGIIPWSKEWGGVINGAYSRTTKKPYSLINQMLLGEEGEYLTFNEIKKLGGNVKKGAKAREVVFYKPYLIAEEKTNEVTGEVEKTEKLIPLLKSYYVFHINDTTGIEPLSFKKNDFNPIEEAEKISSNYLSRENIKLNLLVQNNAYYSPRNDEITLPIKEQFKSSEAYYSTLFHEMTHSTGHESRLNRFENKISFFGSEDYSKEELVAELGSSLAMAYLGIETKRTFNNSVAYLQSWIRALKNDVNLIFTASAKAEKAFNYILGAEA